MKEKFLSYEDVIGIIKDLAQSQGFYGRLLKSIQEMTEEEINEFKETIENQKFKDSLDFILWLEG